MRKIIVVLLLSVSLIFSYVSIEKINISSSHHIVLAETEEDDEDDFPPAQPSQPEEDNKDEKPPAEVEEPTKQEPPEKEKKPNKDEGELKTGNEDGGGSNGNHNNPPTPQPTRTPTQMPVQTNQVEHGPTPVTDVIEEVVEEIEEEFDEEIDEANEKEEEGKSKNDDEFLTLAQLKETEVMITQEDGEFYAIYKDDDDNVIKQKITEFAAIQLGYEKEIAEKEDEQIESMELLNQHNNGLFKKMFGIISTGAILLSLVVGTYVYYRRKIA